MSALGLAGPALSLATEVFRFLNTKESMKYINQAVELKRDIMEEDARGDLADDVRIERKMKELAIITEAAHAQLQAYMSQKATVTTAAT